MPSLAPLHSEFDHEKRAEYRAFAKDCSDLPAFLEPWWLDAAAGPGNWSALLAKRKGVTAALPYVKKSRLGLIQIGQPPLTQFLGPWFSPHPLEASLGVQHKLLDDLIDALPRHFRYRQSWAPEVRNFLAFHWHGFKQSSRCSYRIPAETSHEAAWLGLDSRARGDIRHARKNPKLVITRASDTSAVAEAVGHVFARKRIRAPITSQELAVIDSRLDSFERRDIFAASAEDRNVAAIYVLRGRATDFYLLGGNITSPACRGALSACLWSAIEQSLREGRDFDFEGSMLRQVETYFRSFAPQQVWLNHISRSHFPW